MPIENNPNEHNDVMRGGESGGQGGPGIRDEGRSSGDEPSADTFGATREATRGTGSQSGEGAPRPKQRRGFAAMDPAKQREIASKGGKASHEQGTGHEWDSESAREAGRKGGQASRGGRGKIASPGGSSEGGTGGEF